MKRKRTVGTMLLPLLLLAGCGQEQKGQETGQTLPVMVVASRTVEFQETYSASIRGRQDVDIMPQVSGRITRLCV